MQKNRNEICRINNRCIWSPLNEFRCDYTVQTPKEAFEFQYTFPEANKIRELLFQHISRPAKHIALQQLCQQREELTRIGIEVFSKYF